MFGRANTLPPKFRCGSPESFECRYGTIDQRITDAVTRHPLGRLIILLGDPAHDHGDAWTDSFVAKWLTSTVTEKFTTAAGLMTSPEGERDLDHAAHVVQAINDFVEQRRARTRPAAIHPSLTIKDQNDNG